MQKESLLSSMPKLILAVVLIVCVGAVMGLMGYALTKKQIRVEVPEVLRVKECIEEGGKFYLKPGEPQEKKCCNNLKTGAVYSMIENKCIPETIASVCIDCPNNICGLGENKCNCPEDCEDEKESLDWLPSDLFLISSDKQKIVWTENKNQTYKTNSKLMLADLDGQNRKVLIEKDLDGEKYFDPIRWSNSNEEVYFSEQPGGLGGYIIFSGPTNLSKINIYTSELESLFSESNYIGHISDISPNEELIACFTGGNSPKLTIKNMKTGKENVVDIPIDEGFKGGGNARFSPDNKYLVYNIAHWNPDDEYYRTIVVSSTGEDQRVIIDDSQKIYRAISWVSNNEILLRGPDSIDYIIDINGNNLRKK